MLLRTNPYSLPSVQPAREWLGSILDRIPRGRRKARGRFALRFAGSEFGDLTSQVRRRKHNEGRFRAAEWCYRKIRCCVPTPRSQRLSDKRPAQVAVRKSLSAIVA